MFFYIKLISGLNNKLIPLISLLRISIKENKTIFVYWENNLNISNKNDSIDNFFNIENVVSIKKEQFNKELYNKDNIIYNDNPFYTYTSKKCVFLNIVHPIMYLHEHEHNILKPYPKTPYSKTDLIEEYRIIARGLEIQKLLLEKVEKTISSFVNKNVIGIHLRTSDGGFKMHNHNKIFSFIKEKIKNNNISIYLSCDNIIFEKKIKNLYGDKILLFDTPFGNSYEDKFNRTTYGSLNAFCEMYILSKCNEFYGTPSSSFTFMTWLLRNDDMLRFYL